MGTMIKGTLPQGQEQERVGEAGPSESRRAEPVPRDTPGSGEQRGQREQREQREAVSNRPNLRTLGLNWAVATGWAALPMFAPSFELFVPYQDRLYLCLLCVPPPCALTFSDKRRNNCGPTYGRTTILCSARRAAGGVMWEADSSSTGTSPRSYSACAAGIEHATLYQLRHTVASLLHAQGASLHEIKEILGPSAITLTSDTYTHLYDEGKQVSADHINRVYGTL